MDKSIRPGDWVQSIKQSLFVDTEAQCPVGTIRRVLGLRRHHIFFEEDGVGCSLERFVKVKSVNFQRLYEKLKD